MNRRRLIVYSLLPASVAILSLVACSDLTGVGDPSGIVGTFVLETVDGDALPVRGSHPAGFFTTTELLADTLILRDRAWERSRHLRSGALDGGGETLEYEQRTAGPVTRMEDGWFMLDSGGCDDVGDCLPNEIFEFRNDTVLIDVTADFSFRNLRFVRAVQEGSR